jgi:hypothetical protein
MVSDTIHPVKLLSYRFSFPHPKVRCVGHYVPMGKKRSSEWRGMSCQHFRLAVLFHKGLGAIFLHALRVLHPE